ncbi:MAG: hypothetical protein EB075_13530, partial [Bacteroidetes bacterium]|nr:hypothetical protein [Bacteroidota bacterium]
MKRCTLPGKDLVQQKLLDFVVTCNGAYDWFCAVLILFPQADHPVVKQLTALHSSIFAQCLDEGNVELRRVLAYWLMTLG